MRRFSKVFGLITAIAFCLSLVLGVGANNVILPPLKPHPLPPTLASWKTTASVGDYFSEVETIQPVGYLVWSKFPVTVYLDQLLETKKTSAELQRFEQWVKAVKLAIEEWNIYLPLQMVDSGEEADILIKREYPPLKPKLNPETGLFDLPRAAAAQTRYQFYLKNTTPPILSHRMTIVIRPGQSYTAILATARHELGHAVGIWGHSKEVTDALYFSQVAESPPVSPRDINTLKKVYQQPTRLGWAVN